MLEKGLPKKLDKNHFNIHFVDIIGKKRMPGAQKRKEVEEYNAINSEECKVIVKPNTGAKTLFIDLTVKYPESLIDNPLSLDEIIEKEQNKFIKFYNNVIG